MNDNNEQSMADPADDGLQPSSTRTSSRGSATTTTIVCCARRPSSTTTASASSAIGRAWPRRSPPTSCAICCRSSTTSNARCKADTGADGAEAYRRGVELIHRQLLEVLRKRGVRAIEALGTDFDPHFHQAIAHEPADGRRDGEVIEEFGRGYMLGDRLIRPAIVKVAKGE